MSSTAEMRARLRRLMERHGVQPEPYILALEEANSYPIIVEGFATLPSSTASACCWPRRRCCPHPISWNARPWPGPAAVPTRPQRGRRSDRGAALRRSRSAVRSRSGHPPPSEAVQRLLGRPVEGPRLSHRGPRTRGSSTRRSSAAMVPTSGIEPVSACRRLGQSARRAISKIAGGLPRVPFRALRVAPAWRRAVHPRRRH